MGRHGKKRAGTPVRTGLLGVSAAAAVGAVAVATGLLPGGDTFTIGSSGNSSPVSEIRTDGPPKLQPYGDTGAEATPSPSRTAEPSKAPAPSAPSKKAAEPSKKPKPSATPSKKPAAKPKPTERAAEKPAPKSKAPEAKRPSPSPTREKAPAPKKPSAEPAAPSTSAPSPSLTSAVFTLVNEERALVGCAPVKESDALSKLARAHSDDMAARNYFDHTSPDGASPWTRADAAGVTSLGAENIARGQADAGAVMNAWMESDGHRANILNCDFTTMGIGVHEGDGGPWWTQNFGY
ncbi:CAP domain-containing protein [Streptomyces sp. NPDC005805]|uniref:CAP domain-containing protein n=1 Tax=Streptomyces sp. NPDC005805 TaxID=3157068 RepID=UPI00340BE225